MHLAESAVLLMAYGTPQSENEIEPYLANIRRGRPESREVVEELKERYRKIGGRSPLLEITNAQASALQTKLRSDGVRARVYVGMKHWHPYVKDIVPTIIQNGHKGLVALVLAPHYSKISIGGYKQALNEALGQRDQIAVDFVESWHNNLLLHAAVAEKVNETLQKFPKSTKVEVVFTGHSLPERILEQKDPYQEQLLASSEAVAGILKLDHWHFAYQSASMTGEKWLGPDILEVLDKISGGTHDARVLVVPIGFVADHLEILYDIDIEAQQFAKDHGIDMKRTGSLNTSKKFIDALADIVKRRLT